jgi:hypothetical protein
MKSNLVEHGLSILLVTVTFTVLILFIQKNNREVEPASDGRVQEFVRLGFIDFGDPLDRELFKETLDIFYPDSLARNDSLLQAIVNFRRQQFTNELYKTGAEHRGLSWTKARQLAAMYLQFIVIYIIVMALSYYGAQTLGIARFILMKQNRSSYLAELVAAVRSKRENTSIRIYLRPIVLFLKAFAKGAAYFVLFAPAYVIAYSIKTEFQTDSYFFMILLGVVSNGLLVNYANRFYTFLVSESRKGYVETAVVKSLNNSYSWKSADGIALKSVLKLRKKFPSHVFQHIYLNARHQFRPTLKQYAAFLITGLVIIEMALNIQGHLSYEMLKNILYKQYDVAMSIVLGIFLLVKATEIAVDVWAMREGRRYENK